MFLQSIVCFLRIVYTEKQTIANPKPTVAILSFVASKNEVSLADASFLILNEKVVGFEGYGRANAAETVRWTVFSTPGWRRGRPRPAGNPAIPTSKNGMLR